ncbi:MAG: biotin--[acetyl-CoA-carboxylase] ligase [Smithella sp.]|nr:biotin--[acetyl-CoA-carboxylase] ligase [Smithella sp.]
MKFDLKELNETLTGKLIGRDIHYYDETESTNDVAFSLGIAGAPEGTVVLADSQRGGKGRFQRSWHSPPASNIYTSIILRPGIRLSNASQIPILAGVAAAEVLDKYCPGKISLKWPNDVLLNEKKVSGILSLAKFTANHLDFIILGIGINVNMNQGRFSEEIRKTATSLSIETGREISRQDVLISLYENLEKWYKKLLQYGFDRVKERWIKLSSMTGDTVEVNFLGETVRGIVEGIDDSGSLILMVDGNKKVHVSAGDATILK